MKIKYVLKSKADFQKWVTIGNVFAKSLCPVNEVLKQYNNLTASQRMAIKRQFSEYGFLLPEDAEKLREFFTEHQEPAALEKTSSAS